MGLRPHELGGLERQMKRKKRRRKNKSPVVAAMLPKLAMKGPGLLGFLLAAKPELGLDDVNSLRSNMLRLLADHGPAAKALPAEERAGPALSCLADDERAALLLSLATTVCRAEYHERRFRRVVAHLLERRSIIGAPLVWDAFVHSAVFEATAALGASRTLVDEVIHVTARRYGHARWEASDAVKGTKVAMDVPEVQLLRERAAWFERLNKYRNVLLHRGWKGDAGAYFPPGASEPEARDPERNLLLVPDLESLAGDARAHQWTYEANVHLETLVGEVLDGMRDFVDAVALTAWDGKVPKAGTIPAHEQANTLVACPRPVPFAGPDEIYLPVFSAEHLATSFGGYPRNLGLRLSSVPLLKVLFPEPAFALCLAGFESNVKAGAKVVVVVDPKDAALKERRLSARVPDALLLNPPFIDPVGLPRDAIGSDQLFCWQQGLD